MDYLLSIAGFDPTAGAGVIRDVITFRKFGFYGLGVTTAITYQNVKGFYGMKILSEKEVTMQIKNLINAFSIKFVKTSLVGNKKIAQTIVNFANEYEWFLLVDPLLNAKNSYVLNKIEDLNDLLRRANVITPNVPEAQKLAEIQIKNNRDIIEAGKILKEKYGGVVIIKGGHLNGIDYLFTDYIYSISLPLLPKSVHGTGCIYSSALLALLAQGKEIREAFINTRKFVEKEIKNAIDTGGYSLPN